ncbi:MAG: hypothetical protein FJY99_07515 [Candidatus Sericytochromatia bacterium]|nr:hypothetical protein [Candidatus Tanganyikabacteria bacterium]
MSLENLTRRIRPGLTGLVAGGALGVMLALAWPRTWASSFSILPEAPVSQGLLASNLGAGLQGQLGAFGALMGSGSGGDSTMNLVAYLRSRSLADDVISRSGLAAEFPGKEPSLLREKLRKLTVIQEPGLKSKLIVVTVEAHRPEYALKLARAYLEGLRKLSSDLDRQGSERRLADAALRLDRTREVLAKAEDGLATFQSENKMASLPETLQAAMGTLSQLESAKLQSEAELQSMNSLVRDLHQRVDRLEAAPSALQEAEIRRAGVMGQDKALRQARERLNTLLGQLPPKALKLARLQREVQIQTATFLVVTQQYQSAYMASQNTLAPYAILDPPILPDRHARPKRAAMTIASALAGLLIGVFWGDIRKGLQQLAA